MKLKEVKHIEVKKYDELAIKHLYDDILKLEGVAKYFPSRYPKGRQCNFEYFWNVANTLHETTVKEIVEHALR